MKRIIYTMAALVVLCATLARAEGPEQVKARMLARQPAITALLAQARAGEDNQGYLAARGKLAETEQQLIKDENNDRRLVYEEIANRTKAPVRQVGARRAEAIARQARSGTWPGIEYSRRRRSPGTGREAISPRV